MGLPKVNKAKPRSLPGTASTNADRLRKVIEARKSKQTVLGKSVDIPRPEIMRELANSDEGRAALKEMWDGLDNKQREILIKEVADAWPNPRSKVGFSPEAKRILGVAQTGSLPKDPDRPDWDPGAARQKAEEGTVRRESSEVGKNQGGQKQEGSFLEDQDSPSVSVAAPEGQLRMEAPEDVVEPPRLRRPGKPDNFDPKAAGVKDPTHSSSSIEDREPLRAPDSTTELVDGTVVRNVEDRGGAKGRADNRAINKGRAWEEAQDARAAFVLEKLVALFGSQVEVAKALAKAADGDEAIQAQIDAIRGLADKEVQVPQRPYPVGVDEKKGIKITGEMSPQQSYDKYVLDLISGNPYSSIYQPKRGEVDGLFEAWKILQTKFGKMSPNSTFASPRDMAQQMVNNLSTQDMLDVMPVTRSQRDMSAFGIMAGNDPQKAVREWGAAEITPKDRAVVQKQAIDRLTKIIEERFGSEWGDAYVAQKAAMGRDAGDLTPAPESRLPAEPVSTSRDPASLPQEGGVSNKAGEHNPGSYDERLAEYEAKKAEFDDKTGRPSYMKSDAPYVATPQPPRRGPGDDADVEYTDRIPDFVQKQYEEIMARPEEDMPKPPGRSLGELDPDEQHAKAYQNYKDGEVAKGSSYEEQFADYNARNRNLSPEEIARREGLVAGLKDRMPDLTTERTSDILKEIDALEASLSETPPEISALYKQLEAEGITPSQAKIIRDQIKQANADHLRARADDYSRLDDLKERLGRARGADQITGIKSARRTSPLAGKIKKGEPETGEKPLEMRLEDDGPAITNKPGTQQPEVTTKPAQLQPKPGNQQPVEPPPVPPKEPPVEPATPEPVADPGTDIVPTGPARAMDDMPNFRRGEEVVEDPFDDLAAPEETGLSIRQPLDVGRPIDPLESASPTQMGDDIIDAEFEVRTEADAAARADAAEAPRDAEASRPAQESSSTDLVPAGEPSARAAADNPNFRPKPEEQAPGSTTTQEVGPPVGPQKTWMNYPYRHPIKTATILGGMALPFYQMGANAPPKGEGNGWPDADGAAAGVGGRPIMDPEMMQPTSGDSLGAIGNAGPLTPEERIRLIQSGRRPYVPQGTPQTFYQWR